MCFNQIFTHSFKIFNVYSIIKKRKYAANLHCVDIVMINSLPASPPMLMLEKMCSCLSPPFKKSVKGMGANKTNKSIDWVSRAAGGSAEIIENFDEVIGIKKKSSSHKHKSESDFV